MAPENCLSVDILTRSFNRSTPDGSIGHRQVRCSENSPLGGANGCVFLSLFKFAADISPGLQCRPGPRAQDRMDALNNGLLQ